jgi:hypothetical protein
VVLGLGAARERLKVVMRATMTNEENNIMIVADVSAILVLVSQALISRRIP